MELSWLGAGTRDAHWAVPDVVGGGVGSATLDVDGDVARRVMLEAAGQRAVGCNVGDLVGSRRIVLDLRRRSPTRRCHDLVAAVANVCVVVGGGTRWAIGIAGKGDDAPKTDWRHPEHCPISCTVAGTCIAIPIALKCVSTCSLKLTYRAHVHSGPGA